MVANYEIINFTAIMQHLIDKLTITFKSTWQKLLANKEDKRKSGLHVCFLFLNWKVLSSKTQSILLMSEATHRRNSLRSGALANVSYYHILQSPLLGERN